MSEAADRGRSKSPPGIVPASASPDSLGLRSANESSLLPELVLASTSTYRRALLGRLGLPFRCRPPRCDEDALKEGIEPDARTLAERLAFAKAVSVQAE